MPEPTAQGDASVGPASAVSGAATRRSTIIERAADVTALLNAASALVVERREERRRRCSRHARNLQSPCQTAATMSS